jgi:hypothetical protein
MRRRNPDRGLKLIGDAAAEDSGAKYSLAMLKYRCNPVDLEAMHYSRKSAAARHPLTASGRTPTCGGCATSSTSARRGARHAARRRLLRLRRASRCLGTSCGSSRRSSSTTPPTPRVRVPRHVAWLISPLVVDYFASAARSGASAHRAACHAARRRLLRLHRASRCLGTSRGSSHGSSRRSSSTTPPTPRARVPRHVAWLILQLVIDYFPSAARPGASARRAARHAACRRLLLLRHATRCLGTSRNSSCGSSRRSSSTTLPKPRVRVPRHVARLVTRLVVNYFDYTARPGASACRAARHVARRVARRRLLRLRRASGCLSTSCGSSYRSSSTISPLPRVRVPPLRVRVPRHVVRLVTRLVAPLVIDYSA